MQPGASPESVAHKSLRSYPRIAETQDLHLRGTTGQARAVGGTDLLWAMLPLIPAWYTYERGMFYIGRDQ